MVSESVAVQQMLSRGTTERPAADNHDIEGLGVWAPGGTPQRFVQRITNITPDHVLAEVRVLSSRTRHKWPPVFLDRAVWTVRRCRAMRVVVSFRKHGAGQSQHRMACFDRPCVLAYLLRLF